nr:hypothetical protein [Paenibacillus rubinfantis]
MRVTASPLTTALAEPILRIADVASPCAIVSCCRAASHWIWMPSSPFNARLGTKACPLEASSRTTFLAGAAVLAACPLYTSRCVLKTVPSPRRHLGRRGGAGPAAAAGEQAD